MGDQAAAAVEDVLQEDQTDTEVNSNSENDAA